MSAFDFIVLIELRISTGPSGKNGLSAFPQMQLLCCHSFTTECHFVIKEKQHE